MITLRVASLTVLIAALCTGCASAPATPTAGDSQEPASDAPQAQNSALPTSIATKAADPTIVVGAASPSAVSPPSASGAAVRLPATGVVAAGRYYVDDPNQYLINVDRLMFMVPAGWTADGGNQIYKERGEPGEVKFATWFLTHVFSDVCEWGTLVDAGTTVDELVGALTEQDGWKASAPTDLTVGGFPAKRIELTVPADLDTATCTNGVLRYWPGPGPNLSDGDCCNPPGNTDTLYVVDVAGNRVIVIARHYPGSSADDRAELQALVDSIEIEP
jgi:hypothetical protein